MRKIIVKWLGQEYSGSSNQIVDQLKNRNETNQEYMQKIQHRTLKYKNKKINFNNELDFLNELKRLGLIEIKEANNGQAGCINDNAFSRE